MYGSVRPTAFRYAFSFSALTRCFEAPLLNHFKEIIDVENSPPIQPKSPSTLKGAGAVRITPVSGLFGPEEGTAGVWVLRHAVGDASRTIEQSSVGFLSQSGKTRRSHQSKNPGAHGHQSGKVLGESFNLPAHDGRND